VQDAVTRLVRRKWAGWSSADREDLESLVLEKYVAAFGRERLPNDLQGDPAVPVAWLTKVVQNTGIDAFRKKQVRPAVAVDFANPDGPDVEARLRTAIEGRMRLSVVIADRVDLQRGLRALGDAYPKDLELIHWRLIEDRTLADVAARAGKSEEATKKAIQRAILRLRALLQQDPFDGNSRSVMRRVARRG
jgi:DNA-directed RNA polymerase specialized sigma24 family protein